MKPTILAKLFGYPTLTEALDRQLERDTYSTLKASDYDNLKTDSEHREHARFFVESIRSCVVFNSVSELNAQHCKVTILHILTRGYATTSNITFIADKMPIIVNALAEVYGLPAAEFYDNHIDVADRYKSFQLIVDLVSQHGRLQSLEDIQKPKGKTNDN